MHCFTDYLADEIVKSVPMKLMECGNWELLQERKCRGKEREDKKKRKVKKGIQHKKKVSINSNGCRGQHI